MCVFSNAEIPIWRSLIFPCALLLFVASSFAAEQKYSCQNSPIVHKICFTFIIVFNCVSLNISVMVLMLRLLVFLSTRLLHMFIIGFI